MATIKEETKDRLRDRLEDYLRYMGVDIGNNGGKNFSCLDPNHNDKHPSMSIDKKNKQAHCFACGARYDIFDLIGLHEGITDFVKQVERAGELFGVEVWEKTTAQEDFSPASRSASPVAQNQPKSEQPTHTHMNIHTDIYTQKGDKDGHLSYYRECQKRLAQTDYHTRRGISKEVANRFMLGYDPAFNTKDQQTGEYTKWQGLIIPTGYTNYVVRNTDPSADDKNRYRNRGESIPFNTKALQTAQKPIFIVEGEIDALSIIEAGGEAIGLGSTSNVDKLVKNYIGKQTPEKPLAIALDNDEKGEKATTELEEKLTDLGVPHYRLNPAEGYKDANEALVADRQGFIQRVEKAEAEIARLEAEALEAEREEYLKQSTASHLQEFINGIAESANTPAQTTGFTGVDNILDGGLYEGLYFIGAISSLGKTTFTLQMADQIADSGRDVLIFSLEMARSELMSKSISRQTIIDALDHNIDIANAKSGRGITAGARWAKYSQEEKDLIQRAIKAYGEYAHHIFIHEGIGDIGVAQVRETVEKHKKITGQTPVVFIDYAQILAPPVSQKSLTDKQVVDKNVLELKRISRDYKTPVVCISSFNRDNYSAPVNLASFKESGAIEYSSDVLIGLQYKGMDYQDKETDKEREKRIRTLLKDMGERGRSGEAQDIQLKVLKHRSGGRGSVDLRYYPIFNYFEEA